MSSKLKRYKKTINAISIDDDPLAGDLSDFIKEGGWKIAKFELQEKKDKVLNLRLSDKLLSEIKKQAKKSGLDTQKFVRLILENALRKKAG